MSLAALQPWIHAFGWTLTHFIWQGALVGLAFALARTLVPRDHAEARYAIGLAALAALAICPPATLWLLRPSGMVTAATDALSLAPVLTAQADAAATGMGAPIDLSWLVALWALGVVLVTARAIGQWRTLDHIANRLAWRDAGIEAMFARVSAHFGGIRRVRILVSRHIDTPTLIGWVNPVILLPAAVVLGFPRHQLELILAHELGHLRRCDHIVNLVQTAIETLLFYHPVVHWISREVRHEREVCCDRLVLHRTEREPCEYARTLAALESLRQFPPQLAVAATGGHLLDRVRRIVSSPSSHGRPRGIWFALAGGAGLLAATAILFDWHVTRDTDSVPASMAVTSTSPERPVPELDAPIVPLADARPAITWAALDLPAERAEAQPSVPALAVVDEIPAPALAAQPLTVSAPAPVVAQADGIALDIEDLALEATAVEVPDVVQVERRAPQLVRRIDPVYPDVPSEDSRGHVEFEFSIERNGGVRDISVVSGDARGSFASAARQALRMWRFDANDTARVAGQRFRQNFVFLGISRGIAEGDSDTACRRWTGSNLCRPARTIGLTTEVELNSTLPSERVPVALEPAPVAAAASPHALPADSGAR